jgi:hypothetical protein
VSHGRLSICAVVVASCLFEAGCGGNSTTSTESTAAKQRVAITAQDGFGSAVLAPLRDGALKRDTGTIGPADDIWVFTPDRTVIRDGQKVDIYTASGSSPESTEPSRFESGKSGMTSGTTETATAGTTASRSAPGRSSSEQATTPGSGEAAGVLMKGWA